MFGHDLTQVLRTDGAAGAAGAAGPGEGQVGHRQRHQNIGSLDESVDEAVPDSRYRQARVL